MPMARPKRDKQIINPWPASMTFLAGGESSGALPGNLASNSASNAIEKHRRRKTLPRMATTAAAVTEAERFAGESIERLYNTSRLGVEEDGEGNAKEKRSLTFAFFSPKVPMEKICKERRAHDSDQKAKRSSQLPRGL